MTDEWNSGFPPVTGWYPSKGAFDNDDLMSKLGLVRLANVEAQRWSLPYTKECSPIKGQVVWHDAEENHKIVWRMPKDPPELLSEYQTTLATLHGSDVRDSTKEEQKAELRRVMQKTLERTREEIKTRSASLAELKKRREYIEWSISVYDEVIAWAGRDTSVLQSNEHSRVHRLIECARDGRVIHSGEDSETERDVKDMQSVLPEELCNASVFVVSHDWAAVLGDQETGDDVEVALPYENCVFEFMVSGHCVVLWAKENQTGNPDVRLYVETPKVNGWYSFESHYKNSAALKVSDHHFRYAARQLRAICVVLESQVATHQVTRAPHKLNAKREKAGKTLLRDFHVVDLSRRSRGKTDAPSTGSHASPRLHFRRGHWRHYPDHKTWIKWTLVGNPDLGFIDKRYKI